MANASSVDRTNVFYIDEGTGSLERGGWPNRSGTGGRRLCLCVYKVFVCLRELLCECECVSEYAKIDRQYMRCRDISVGEGVEMWED